MKKILQSKFLHMFLGIAVSVVLVVWLVRSVNGDEVRKYLRGMNYIALIPVIVLLFAQFWLRAFRWRFLLPDGERVPLRTLFDALMLGNFATFVLPLRAGEFVRPFVLSRQSDRSFPIAFASVVIERFFDLSVVLIFFGVMTALLGRMPPLGDGGIDAQELAKIHMVLGGVALMLSLVAVAILCFMITASYAPQFVIRAADFFLRPLGEGLAAPLRRLIRDFLAGTAVLRRPRNLVVVTVLSLLVWLSTILGYYVFLLVFPEMPASIWLAFLITVILALGVAAPSAPGFIGVYHGSCVAAFALAGVSIEKAAAYAIVSHGVPYLIVIMYGAFLLVKYGLRVGELWRAREEAV